MNTILKKAAWMALLSSGLLLAAIGIDTLLTDPLRKVDFVDHVIQIATPIGEAADASFVVANPNSYPVRILGGPDLNNSCTRYGCVLFDGFPVVVPPHENKTITGRLIPKAVGSNEVPVQLLTDDPSQPLLEATLQIEILPSGS